MSLTAKRRKKSWYSNHPWVKTVILVMVLALLVIAYIKVIEPRLRSDGSKEKGEPAIKVAIKNGCGIEQLASDYAKYIKNKNIDVVNMGDTPHPIYNKSLIEAKVDDKKDLQRLQDMTGIQRFTLAVDSSYEAPYIIILGADYEDFIKK